MRYQQLTLQNLRSFRESHSIILAPNINLFVGHNNSGKTTILNALHLPQDGSYQFSSEDVSHGQANSEIRIKYDFDPTYTFIERPIYEQGYDLIVYELGYTIRNSANVNAPNLQYTPIKQIEPRNLIYPYSAKRKVTAFEESVRLEDSSLITGTHQKLYARVDQIANPNFLPSHQEYLKACENILGFPVSAVQSTNGKRAAYTIRNFANIAISKMGEGVASLLGLIVDLCMTNQGGKIFIIEEPENDIHPKALRALLDLIEEKSQTNQFFISTHSNIVAKRLGSIQEAKIFEVKMSFTEERIPSSTVNEVPDNAVARRQLLEDLGYEFYDNDLHAAWLFLEESSAEEIIRDFLIPDFAPNLKNRLRTFSCSGFTNVPVKIDDFTRLFVFVHLEPVYKDRAWVAIDDGDDERAVLEALRNRYPAWNPENFHQFTKHDFEYYYPEQFHAEFERVKQLPTTENIRKGKASLLNNVKTWYKDHPDEAKAAFQESAQEIIVFLQTIETSLRP